MKRLKIILIFIFIALIFILFFKLDFKWDCPFKKILHISCPGCGLTRSFKAIMSFDFVSSIKYNILGIPLFTIGLLCLINLVIDYVKNEETFFQRIYMLFKKYYIIAILVLIITMIINNINGV